jgi:hypothetical protein
MTEEAQALMRVLLRRHDEVCKNFNVTGPDQVDEGMILRSVISYGVLCERAGAPFLTRIVGQFLGEVAELCAENTWPPLNSMAVNGDTNRPGEGYDTAVNCSFAEWERDVRRCIAFPFPPTI